MICPPTITNYFATPQIYGERPWRVVQVSSEIRRMYRVSIYLADSEDTFVLIIAQLLLGFSVVMQITGLMLPATLGLWVDRLINTYFSQIVGNHRYIYGSVFIFLTCVSARRRGILEGLLTSSIKALPLWAALVSNDSFLPFTYLRVIIYHSHQGWFSLRREWKRLTAVFLGSGVVLLCCVLVALASAMFIWTVTTWRLFMTFYVLTVILIIATIILAALCRNNFDKNLDHYRKSIRSLPVHYTYNICFVYLSDSSK